MTALEIDKTTKNIVARLCAEYAPEKIILFGEFAREAAQAGNDLDF